MPGNKKKRQKALRKKRRKDKLRKKKRQQKQVPGRQTSSSKQITHSPHIGPEETAHIPVLPAIIENLINLKYSPQEISKRTKTIYNDIISKSLNITRGNFDVIGTEDMQKHFYLYDRHFFNTFFHDNYRDVISFRLSRKMTKLGGKTEHRKDKARYRIVLSTYLLFQTFQDIEREIVVNGIVCHNRLEAAMRVLEHEIIHLLEMVLFHSSSCRKPRFKQLSRNIFGHTGVTHQLVTQAERAWKNMQLCPGEKVEFEFEGKMYQGIISRITKRATVLVEDPEGYLVDTKGTKYRKYYIPLQFLRKIGNKTK